MEIKKKKTMENKRECQLMQVAGMKGVGKSYRTNEYIRYYLQKHGRKVLIYNINAEDTYKDYKTIDVSPRLSKDFPSSYDIYTAKKDTQKEIDKKITKWRVLTRFRKLRDGQIRCVTPIWRDGREMNATEKKQLLKDILSGFRGGLLVIEDIDKYATRSSDQDIIGALSTNRHLGIDIIVQHQSVGMISAYEWRNSNHLRLHKTLDSVESCGAVPEEKRTVIKLAESIVKNQYEHDNERYFCYISLDKAKISGCSVETFVAACKVYLNENPSIVKRLTGQVDDAGHKKYDHPTAFRAAIVDLMKYHKS